MQKPKDNIVEKIYLEIFSDVESERETAARERLKAIMKEHAAVDEIRKRFGYFSIQRGLMYQDKLLSSLDAKGSHTVHPQGYFS